MSSGELFAQVHFREHFARRNFTRGNVVDDAQDRHQVRELEFSFDTVVTAPASSLISRGRHDDGRRKSSACAMNSAALEYIGLRNIRS